MNRRVHAQIRAEKMMYKNGNYHTMFLAKPGMSHIIGKRVFAPNDIQDEKKYAEENYPGWGYDEKIVREENDGKTVYSLVIDGETVGKYDDPTVYTEG